MNKVEKIKAKIERLKESLPWGSCASQISMECNCKNEAYNEVLSYIDSLEEDPVSNDLEEAATSYVRKQLSNPDYPTYNDEYEMECAFEAGAKWRQSNLWHPADGDYLPEYEREVVVFIQDFPETADMMRVAIAHRPNPNGWDGKSITTGKVEHYTPKTYDKDGWNIPDVKIWLDCDLPKTEE